MFGSEEATAVYLLDLQGYQLHFCAVIGYLGDSGGQGPRARFLLNVSLPKSTARESRETLAQHYSPVPLRQQAALSAFMSIPSGHSTPCAALEHFNARTPLSTATRSLLRSGRVLCYCSSSPTP